jgi:hypothetical protein
MRRCLPFSPFPSLFQLLPSSSSGGVVVALSKTIVIRVVLMVLRRFWRLLHAHAHAHMLILL